MATLLINNEQSVGEVVNLDWIGKDLFCQITGISPKAIHNHRKRWQEMGLSICQLLPYSKSYIYSLQEFYKWCDQLNNENCLKVCESEPSDG